MNLFSTHVEFYVPARNGSRTLASLTKADRADIISMIADLLIKKEPEILAANKLDLEKAQLEGITGPMFSRYIQSCA